MRHWDLDTSESQLRGALQDLQRAWNEVSESWNDEISRKFSEEHLDPLLPTSKMALDAVARMRELLNRMQLECEE